MAFPLKGSPDGILVVFRGWAERSRIISFWTIAATFMLVLRTGPANWTFAYSVSLPSVHIPSGKSPAYETPGSPEHRVFLRRHVKQAEFILLLFAYGPSWFVTKRIGFGCEGVALVAAVDAVL
jgi:hypothetical protein